MYINIVHLKLQVNSVLYLK